MSVSIRRFKSSPTSCSSLAEVLALGSRSGGSCMSDLQNEQINSLKQKVVELEAKLGQ